VTALIGESGCGKSTLLALIQRLYTPQAGRIFIGERDIQYFRLESLRRNLGVVAQQSQLFSGTVLENLVPTQASPDMKRLISLCRELGILEFIEKLPQGFFTYLNENGANLSGGQRQRLALVRAFYADAPILLLDEPSSALDRESEQLLVKMLQRLRLAGRTIIVATHTTGLQGLADQIIFLKDGQVTDVRQNPGNYAEIVSRLGLLEER
jgi:ATP-binding cassette subfamily B protein